jgi:hypothetical protein
MIEMGEEVVKAVKENEEGVESQGQQKLKNWKDDQKYKTTLEELFNGNVRYMKFIKTRIPPGSNLLSEAFQATIDYTFDKTMAPLIKLGESYLSGVPKQLLLKRLLGNFFINMQHVVRLECIQKLIYYPDYAEIIIDKCTGKQAWIMGVKNNKAGDLFTDEDYCKYSCAPLVNRFLKIASAQSTVEFQKEGCHHIIKIMDTK